MGDYVKEGRLPNGWWYVGVVFLLLLATALTVSLRTPTAAFMYFWPVYLYLVGWGQTEDRRPDGRRSG